MPDIQSTEADSDPEPAPTAWTIAPTDFVSLLLAVLFALACLLVNLKTAAEQAKLAAVERQIAAVRREIKSLTGEFESRSSFAQLEKWNRETLRLSVPQPSQYVKALPASPPGSPAESRLHSVIDPEARNGVKKADFGQSN